MFNRLVKFRRGGDKYEDLDESNIDLDITDPAMKNIVNSGNSMEMSDNPEEVQPKETAESPDTEESYTLQQAIDAIGFGKFQVKLSILTGFAWMADAMEMMILAILSPALHCEWQLEGWQQASITTEQEARTEFLRVKSRKRIEDAGNSSNQVDCGKSEERSQESAVSTFGAGALSEDIYSGKHINFFKETDGMVVSDRKNAEHEADKKKEQEEWEKKVGILTYLGQSSNETSASWYNQRKRKHEDEEEDGNYEKQKSREKNRKLQDHLDPIRQMDCYLEKKKHKDKDEKHKKHKKKKHRQDREKSSSKQKTSSSSKQKPKASIEQLRAERLKREMEERQRTAQLLAKHRGEKTESKSQEVSEREQTYNSQFNPELARKPSRKPHVTRKKPHMT